MEKTRIVFEKILCKNRLGILKRYPKRIKYNFVMQAWNDNPEIIKTSKFFREKSDYL